MKKRSAAKKEHDSQAAFACGAAFQRSAEEFIPRIGAMKETTARTMSSELGDVVACATNLGFAIELYLKALLIHLDLLVPQVHDLRVLYDRLPQRVRSVIESVYDTALPRDVRRLRGRWCFVIARGPMAKPPREDHSRISVALPDVLARSRDLFQSWRYVFEFSPRANSSYQFHQFEYGLLRCAAEAMRVEIAVRLDGTGEAPSPSLPTGEP